MSFSSFFKKLIGNSSKTKNDWMSDKEASSSGTSKTSISNKKPRFEPPLPPMGGLTMDQLPSQIVTEIFYWLDTNSLSTICPQVCRQWYDVLSDNVFWLELCIKTGRVLPPKNLRQKYHERFDYKKILIKMPFGRNLIRNPSGAEGRSNWQMEDRGDGWRIEKPPVGADHDFESCFASSYGVSSKQQNVDLEKEGCDAWILDEIGPKITVSESHAARWDCGARYKFCPSLCNNGHIEIVKIDQIEHITEQWLGREWNQVQHEFVDYPVGVRHVLHSSEGSDTQFWAGHYGAKMANASVVISFV